MPPSDNHTLPPLTLLFVDDEEGVLRSMKRLFHRSMYEVLTATSGEQALAILAKKDVQVIVSDMRMPGMSGAEFLAQVAELYPDTYRIILSGYADYNAVIETVNKGRIHRFLEKPWENSTMLQAIEAGFDYAKVKLDNQVLQAQIAIKNDQLTQLNQDLEAKVEHRTKQIRAALTKLERSNAASHKVLFNLISINPLIDGAFAQSVSSLALRLGQRWGIEQESLRHLGLAGLLVEIGKLGLSPDLIETPFYQLNYEQQQEYLRQTDVASLILAPSPYLQPVADILAQQFEPYKSGEGAAQGSEPAISESTCILAIARDFWRYCKGRLLDQEMDSQQALAELRKYRGTRYHPEILDLFAQHPGLAVDKQEASEITSKDLTPGMVLKRNLFTPKHILILPEDHVFTEQTIARLRHYEQSLFSELTLWVDSHGELNNEQAGT